jgi:putative inorganic carbon (HCO3(-)) transporter
VNINYQATSIQYRLSYLIEHCLLAVAFFLPLSLNVTSVFLAVGAILWTVKMVYARRLEFRRTPFDILVALLVVLSAVSILFSPDRGVSFYNYYHLMGRYIVLYYLVINNVNSIEQVKRLVIAVLCSSAAVAAYGFYQYFHGVDISAFEWVDGEQFPDLKIRVFSTLKNPNLLAGFLVTIMSVATGIGLTTSRLKNKLLLFGLTLALGICLVFTYSRGAWLSVLAVILVYGMVHNRKILWLLAVLPILLLIGHDVVMERIVSILNPTDTSSTLRMALWESTLAMIGDKPIFGIGWGAYWMVYPAYDFFVQDAGTKIFHAHNMYLHIAAEIGIPGLLVFLTIMFGHLKTAREIAGRASNRWLAGLMLGIMAAFTGIAVSGFTDYILFNIQLSMLFWLMCAITIVTYQICQRNM